MSEPAVKPVQLPGSEDIRKINALLREDLTSDVRGEVVDRLVMLAAREPHPRAKAAMFERAARLVIDFDAERSVILLRESFRQFPQVQVGQRLAAAGDEEAALQRLGRMSVLYDSIAAITDDPEERHNALLSAAQYHVERGHGRRTLNAIGKLSDELQADDMVLELTAAAEARLESRALELGETRERIAASDDSEKGAALLAYARLLLEGDEPLAEASVVLADALESDAEPTETAPLWAEVARAVGEPEMLARALAASLEHTEAAHDRMRVADELVNLPGVDERTPALAQKALESLVEAMPDDSGLRARLLVARSASGDPAADRELDRVRLDAVRNRDRGAEAVVCLALARIARRDDNAAKEERYLRRVRTLDPRNGEALDFFESRYRDAGDNKRLYLVLTHRLAISQGEELVRVALEMARLAEEQMANHDRAIEAYHRVLAVHPNNRVAMEGLERLYRTTQRWSALRDLLDRRARTLGSIADATEDTLAEGVVVLQALSQLHLPDGVLPDDEALFQTYRRLQFCAADDDLASDYLIARYRRDEAWRPLASVLESRLEVTDEPAVRAGFARELYGVYRERLDDEGRARATLARLVADAPDDIESLRLLEDASRRSGDDVSLLDALVRLHLLVEGDARIATLEEAAGLAEVTDAQERAIELYTELLTLRPQHMAASRGLTRLYATVGQHAELAALIDSRLSHEDVERSERVELLEQLVRSRTHVGEAEAAEAAAAILRELDPDSRIGAAAILRGLLFRSDFGELRAMHGQDKPGAQAYVDSLVQRAESLQLEPGARALLAAAEAQASELKDFGAAAASAHAALLVLLEADEADSELVAEAARTLLEYAEASDEGSLQMLAVAILVEHSEGELNRMYMAQRVALCEEQSDALGAYEAMTALLAARVEAGDLDGIVGAAERLGDLSESAASEAEVPALLVGLSEVMLAEKASEEMGVAAVELLIQAAEQALLRATDAEVARQAVDLAMVHRPDDLDLIRLHERVCSEQGDWQAVVEALVRLAEGLTDDGRADTLLRAASLCDGVLGDVKRAEELYRSVIEQQPESAEAWAGLLEVLRYGDDSAALGAALEAFVAAPVDDLKAQSQAAFERIEGLAEEDADGAAILAVAAPVLRHIASAEELFETDQAVLTIVAARLKVAEDAHAAAELLLPAARKHDRHDDILCCYDVLAGDIEKGSDTHVARLFDMAQMASSELGDADRAWGHLREALLAAPQRADTFERLAAAASEQKRGEEFDALICALADVGEIEGVQAAEAGLRPGLLRRWAESAMAAEQLDTAIQAWTLVREVDAAAIDALDALEALYRESEDPDAVALILEQRLEGELDADDRESTWLRLVDVHASDRDASDDAIEVSARGVTALPDSAALRATHLQGLRDHGAPAELVKAMSTAIAMLKESTDEELVDERRLLVREAALLAQDKLDDRDGAIEGWRELLQADSTDDEAAERLFEIVVAAAGTGLNAPLLELAEGLEPIYEERSEFERVDALLSARIEALEGGDRLLLWRHQATLREVNLHAPALAFESLGAALKTAPQDDEIVGEMNRLADAADGAPTALAVGSALADAALAADGDRRRLLRMLAVDWLRRDKAETSAMTEVYRAMLADDPSDREALDGLDALLKDSGDTGARLAVLEARIQVESDPELQLATRLEHARLAMELGDDEAAVRGYSAVVEVDDSDARTEAAAALVDIHERRDEPAPLAANLLRLREWSDDADSRLAFALRAAEHQVAADDRKGALETLRAAEAEAGTDLALYGMIEEQLRAGDDQAALVAHFERGWREVYATDPDHAALRLAAALAQLDVLAEGDAASRLSLVAGALDAGLQEPRFDDALAELTADAADDVARLALDRQIGRLESADQVAHQVAARLERLDRFPDAVNLRQERAELAGLLETGLEDPGSALAQWQQIVLREPTDEEAIAEMFRLAEANDEVVEAEALLRSAAGGLQDCAARTAVRMGGVERAMAREDNVAAADLLDEILADEPGHADAQALRGAVLEEFEGDDSLPRLVAHYQHGIEHAADADARRVARTLLAELHRSRLSEPVAAFELVSAQLQESPEAADSEHLYRLAEACADEAGVTEPLWELLETEAESLGSAGAERWGALATRCTAFEVAHGRARRFAEKALTFKDGDKTEAIEALASVHATSAAADPELVDLLVAQLRQSDPARAAGLLQAEAEGTSDDERRRLCLETVAALAAEGGEGLDVVAALAALASNEPEREELWQRLIDTAGDKDRERATEALLGAYEGTTDGVLRQRLMARAADVSAAGGDDQTASAYLRMALEELEDPDLRSRLESYLEAAGEYEMLAVDLEDRAEQDESQRTALLERALDVWLDKVGDAEHGLMVLDGLLALHPERVDLQDRRLDVLRLEDTTSWRKTLAEALDAVRAVGDGPRLARLLPKAIEADFDDATAGELHARLVELADAGGEGDDLTSLAVRLMDRVDDLPDVHALQVLAWAVEGIDPGGDPGTWMTARLRQVDLVEEPDAQRELLESLVIHATDRLEDLDLAVEWLARAQLLDASDLTRAHRLVRLADSEERAETALPALQATFSVTGGEAAEVIALAAQLVEMAPSDPETWRILESRCEDDAFCRQAAEALVPVYRRVQQSENAVALQRLYLQKAPPAERAAGMLVLADDLALLPERAVEAVQLLTEQAPEVEEPMVLIEHASELARTHNLLGDWLDGVEMLVTGEQLDSVLSLTVVAMSAGIAAAELDDPTRAAELWTRAWDLEPDSEDARDAVLALRREVGDAEQLATDLDRALMQGNVDGATELRMELAELCRSQMNRPGEALHQARAVLRDVPEHVDALALIEDLIQHPAHAAQALQLLEGTYRQAERWSDLARTLATSLELRGGGQESLRGLRELADVQQHHLNHPGEAIDTLLKQLKLAPDEALLDRIVGLAKTAGRQEVIGQVYQSALPGLKGAERVHALAAAVEFHGAADQATDDVESLLLQLIEADPSRVDAWESLDSMYDDAERWTDLLGLLRRRLGQAGDDDERRMILHRLGGIAQATSQITVAVDAYEQLAALDVDDPDAATMLVDLLRPSDDHGRLADALLTLSQRTEEPTERTKLLCEAARVKADQLSDAEGAGDLYYRAFDLSPASDEAFIYLERANQDEPRQLMKLYRHRSMGVKSGAARTLILRKLATVCSHMGRGAEARTALEKALEDDPGNPAIDESLLDVCLRHDDIPGYRVVAARRLTGDLPRLERIALLRELIRTSDDGDDAAALEWIEALRSLVPDDKDLGVLQAMCQSRSDDPTQAAEGLERVVRETEDSEAQIPMLERLAGLYAGPLDNSRKAISAYQRILRIEPRRWEVHRSLCDLYAARESHEARAECLRHWLGLLDDGDAEKIPVLVELGEALLGLSQEEEAIAVYQQAHDIDGKRLEVNQPLARLLIARGELERGAEMLKSVVAQLRRLRRRDELADASMAAADVLERLERHEDARRSYRTVLGHQPKRTSALLGLGRTSLALGDVQRAMVEFDRVARQRGKGISDSERALAQMGLGRCWKARDKKQQARACFNKALDLDPGSRSAIDEIDGL